MLISVIIPCYNVTSYIDECLDSIMSQIHPNIEIICIDNNSSDQTYRSIQNYKARYPDFNLKLIKEKKPGASAARNTGLTIAKGDWIQFLDADDLLLPTKISHQLKLLEADSSNDFIAGACIRQTVDGQQRNIFPEPADPWLALLSVTLGNTCANLFRRSALEEIGGWNETLQSSQEYDLMFRLLRAGDKVLYDREPLTIIRERAKGSISQVDILGNNLRRLEHLCQIRDYFKTNGFTRKYLDNANQSIFQEIRRIYRLAPQTALESYKKLFDQKPIIHANTATSGTYVKFYKLLGFKVAQKTNSLYHFIKENLQKIIR
ncbi:MAG: glycosyltransferase family 2 protein [Flavobacteriaceae bacterium]|nr:glycosyltransferase family 2 protein [Flavobacteriaceae bacterium]MCB9299005.1 glycosyltransferase family 2 protein [Lewinellaceae bacterium]